MGITFVLMVCLTSHDGEGGVNHTRVDSLLEHGSSELKMGNTEEARRLFQSVLEMDEASIPALIGLANVELEERNWGDASGYANEVLDLEPNSVEGHYLAAIAYRESGTQRALIFRVFQWNTSEDHFDWILANDSLFKDVLYQYALFRRYKEEYDRAFELGEEQVRLKPDCLQGQLGLFKLYRFFVATADRNSALTWLRSHPSTLARYCEGELYRREKRLREASTVFRELMAVGTDLPLQAMYLSMAKVAFQQGNARRAELFYWRAVDNISSWLGAEMVFEDLKYIVMDEEVRLFRSLSLNAEKRAFYHAFWERRNPTPSARPNRRLIEHFRRYLHAEEEFDNSRDRFS
jgi:tetratricopeptide (TPR) repeat protein